MEKADIRIEDWKRKLIDLTRRNRLLFFKPARSSSLKVIQPSSDEVFRRLVVEEKPWKFFMPPEENEEQERPARDLMLPLTANVEKGQPTLTKPLRRPDELLCQTREARKLRTVLRNLHRRSRSDFEERGVRILYVTFGTLEWKETQESEPVHSPLLLVPAQILRVSANDPFEISAAEEEIVVNPALDVKLRNDFRLELPSPPDEWEEAELDNYLAEVDKQLQPRNWNVSGECWIGLFSFHKLVMYQDLNSHANLIKQHPVVRALAGENGIANFANGNLPDPRDLDNLVHPKESYLVVDADSSQLACIEAVKRGVSLVLQGPPGTGKSQTITNLIAESIAAGRKVLFVSEKMAALEVVYKRLRDANLGHYCLELHSQKANKREVVAEIYRCYRESLQPRTAMTELEFQQLVDRRRQLNDYVNALHLVREPLGESAYDVLGELAELERVQFVAPDDIQPETLTQARLDGAVQLARRLGRVWKVVVEGEHFPYRDCMVTSYGPETRTTFQVLIHTCEEVLTRLVDEGQRIADAFGLPAPTCLANAQWLLQTGDILREGPSIEVGWLVAPELDLFTSEARRYSALSSRRRALREELGGRYTEAFFQLSVTLEEEFSKALDSVSSFLGREVRNEPGIVSQRDAILRWIRDLIDRIHDSDMICDLLGLPAEHQIAGLRRLVRIADLCQSDDRPDPKWFDPAIIQKVSTTLSNLQLDHEARAAARAQILQEYNESILSLANLGKFDETLHTVLLALGLEINQEPVFVSHRSAIPIWVRNLMNRLNDWERDSGTLCELLGLPTKDDIEGLWQLVRITDLCQSNDRPDPKWFDVMALDEVSEALPKVRLDYETRTGVREQLLQDYDESVLSLDVERLYDDITSRYASSLRWLKLGFYRLRREIRRHHCDGRHPADLLRDLRKVRDLKRLEAKIDTESGHTRDLLGSWYRGHETNFGRVEKALGIAKELVALSRGSPPEKLVRQACLGSVPSVDLQVAARRLKESLTAFEEETASLSRILTLERLPTTRLPIRQSKLAEVLAWAEGLMESLESIVTTLDGAKEALRSREDYVPSKILSVLRRAQDLLQLEAKICRESEPAKDLLGLWYRGDDTDFARVKKAVAVAKELLELSGPNPPEQLIKQACFESARSAELSTVAMRLRESLGAWDKALVAFGYLLPLDRFPSTGLPFQQSGLEEVLAWAKGLVQPLEAAVAHLDAIEPSLRFRVERPSAEILTDLSCLAELRRLELQMLDEADRLRATYGSRFAGLDTDWDKVLGAIEWTRRLRKHVGAGDLPERLSEIASRGSPAAPEVDTLRNRIREFREAFAQLTARFEHTDEPSKSGFLMTAEDKLREQETRPQLDGQPLFECAFDAISQRLQEMGERLDEIRDWVDYKTVEKEFRQANLHKLYDGIIRQPFLQSEEIPDIVRRGLLHAWIDWLFKEEPALGHFRLQDHETSIAEFRELDRKHSRIGAHRVILEAERRKPKDLVLQPGGEVTVLFREANKKKRHLPIRHLFTQMPNLLVRLKPCLLMSPLSVSQFLDPQQLHFDLVIFDEASQICSEDAVGAIYRGRQLVVCGDNKQLPPTAFFEQGMSDEFENQDATEAFDVFDSILDECASIGMPPSWLHWHYRSRHESLITFSNRRFYEDRLVTFPASRQEHPERGIKFVHVPDGIYDRGGRRDNPREAERVVDLVVQHFLRHPNRSLGIVAFSVAQMNAIEDRIEYLLHDHPEFERFFTTDRFERFFVKNLENVQGDERDVIIFSIGYGRDQQGRLTMNFGPLNLAGGERRLNVAVTRAREKVIVVSSIRAADLDLSITQAPGVFALYHYLDYAERGPEALELRHPGPSGDFESPLERDVAGAIRALGYDVVPQVGCSSFRIDLGVVEPAEPGRFILGVECDGASYHSAYTARDRDRLRQEILEQLGWRIHRIWSPDWVTRRETEVRRLREAIEQARALVNRRNEDSTSPNAPKTVDRPIVIRTKTPQSESKNTFASWAVLYKTCRLQTPPTWGVEFHEPAARKTLALMLTEVIDAEGPVHLEIAARRLASRWGLQKVGGRMMNAVEAAFDMLARQGTSAWRGKFLWPQRNGFTLQVRRPDPDDETTIRKIEFIPQEELELAIRYLVRDAISISDDQVLTQVARVFGFDRTGANIRDRMERILGQMLQGGILVRKGDRISLGQDGGG